MLGDGGEAEGCAGVRDAERRGMYSYAERGNERTGHPAKSAAAVLF